MIRAQINDQRRQRILGTYAANRFPVNLTIPLKHISNFFRRLDFTIMNQLVEIEFNINTEQSILRANGVQASRFQMFNVTLFVPEVVLPAPETTKLLKIINSGDLTKELSWDGTEIIERTTNLAANETFSMNFLELICLELIKL